jgi:hypothetical protein
MKKSGKGIYKPIPFLLEKYRELTGALLNGPTPTPSLSLQMTAVVGLITDEVRDLAVLCQDKNLSLNVSKTKRADHGLQEIKGKSTPPATEL